jgi:hypothetical protein
MAKPRVISSRLHLPPFWTLLLAVGIGSVVVAWRIFGYSARTDTAESLASIILPGLGAVAGVYVIAWLGWALDIDS